MNEAKGKREERRKKTKDKVGGQCKEVSGRQRSLSDTESGSCTKVKLSWKTFCMIQPPVWEMAFGMVIDGYVDKSRSLVLTIHITTSRWYQIYRQQVEQQVAAVSPADMRCLRQNSGGLMVAVDEWVQCLNLTSQRSWRDYSKIITMMQYYTETSDTERPINAGLNLRLRAIKRVIVIEGLIRPC